MNGHGVEQENALDETRPRQGGPAGVDRGGRIFMRACHLRPLHAAAVLLTLLLGGWGFAAQAQNSASTAQHPDPWPRELHIDGATMTVYEPQVDSWDGGFLKFRAAVALKPDGA